MERRRLHADEGFSLSEMLVVIALLGLVLAGAWALFRLVAIGSAQSGREAWLSREVAQPLENLERAFSQQAPPMTEIGRYRCKIRTDQDSDNLYEIHVFEATTDGRLIETYYEETGSTTVLPTTDVRTWSDFNMNRSTSTPLFTYVNRAGDDISDQSAVIITQDAASVVLTIVTEHEGKQYTGSRRVYFRNR